MSKLFGFVLLVVALAGTANAASWRSLHIDASSEAALEQSLAEFEAELNAARLHVLREALQDVWVAGMEQAAAEQRDYAAADYLREIDGLTYEQVVELTDPTGRTALNRYRAAVAATLRSPTFASATFAPTRTWGARPATGWGTKVPGYGGAGLGN